MHAQLILALSHDAAGRLSAIGPSWLAPDSILHWFGPLAVLGVLALVFAETGLLVGFFLPGDSLLFTAGLLTVTGFITMPVIVLGVLVFLAAFVGDQVGFMIGRRAGPRIFTRPDSRLFRQEYVEKTNAFFVRYGGRAVILARFVPIVRTFAPVAAGVGAMPYRQFVGFNAIGAFAWGTGVTLLGAWLGQLAFVRANIELILVAIVAISVVPIAAQLLRAKRRTGREIIASRTAPAQGQPS